MDAPILPSDHEAAQIELTGETDQVGDVVRERERSVDARMVGVAAADPIRRNGAIAGACER